MDVGWTNESIIEFIKFYKSRPALWDKNHAEYRNNPAKVEAWSEMATFYSCDVADIKRKLNSLLASFRRERSKERIGKTKSSWFAYPYFKFLLSRENPGDAEESEPEDLEHVEFGHSSDSPKAKPNVTVRPRLVRKIRRKVPVSVNSDTQDGRLYESLKLLVKEQKKRDECDVFGEYVANSLRTFDHRTRAVVRHAINNLLFEAEMKKYSAERTINVVCNPLANDGENEDEFLIETLEEDGDDDVLEKNRDSKVGLIC